MKYFQLVETIKYLQTFNKINSIYRTDLNTLKIEFDQNNHIYFYMKRGESIIYKKDGDLRQNQLNRPFDIQLSNRFNRSKIEKIELINNDRIIRIYVQLANRYKIIKSAIQFEFTGKYTNIILLDSDETIIEALNYVSEYQSIRSVKIGEKLENPPHRNVQFQNIESIEDIEQFLKENFINLLKINLKKEQDKSYKFINEKKKKLEKHLAEFESREVVSARADQFQKLGEIILANFYNIAEYSEYININDFNGNLISFKRPNEAKDNSHMAKIFFNNARKLRKRAKIY